MQVQIILLVEKVSLQSWSVAQTAQAFVLVSHLSLPVQSASALHCTQRLAAPQILVTEPV